MITYESIPDGYEFSTEFPTYILGFCPDTDSWFATNQRFFFYEYPNLCYDLNGVLYYRFVYINSIFTY